MRLNKHSWLKALCKGLLEASIWSMWALLVGLVALFVLIGVFEYFGVLDEQSPDWLMAVGSVGAVLAAVFIASYQSREQANVRRQKEMVVETSLIALAERAADVLDELVGHIDFFRSGASEERRRLVGKAEQCLLAIQGISLAELPRAELVEPLLTIRGGLEQCIFIARPLSDIGRPVQVRDKLALHSHSSSVREAVARLA